MQAARPLARRNKKGTAAAMDTRKILFRAQCRLWSSASMENLICQHLSDRAFTEDDEDRCENAVPQLPVPFCSVQERQRHPPIASRYSGCQQLSILVSMKNWERWNVWGIQVSAEVKSFSISIAEAKGLRKSLNTEDSLIDALKHCFLFQGESSLPSSSCFAIPR